MVEYIPKLLPHLPKNKINNEIVGIAISMILDRSMEDITIQGLVLLRSLVKIIGPDLVERYFFREIVELVSDESPPICKIVVDIIAEVVQMGKGDNFKEKLLGLFYKFCDNDNWNIRKHCVSGFPVILKHSSKEVQNTLIPHFIKFLKDKSKWVKEIAVNSCGLVIINLQITIPEPILKTYLHLSEAGTQGTSFYFSAVFLTIGVGHWSEMKKVLNKILEGDTKNHLSIVYSMHEIAKILGAETSVKDLIDIYDQFLDSPYLMLDAYMNLPNFLRELFPEDRDKYKTIIKSMGRDENNWRSRDIFARNICEFIGVYDYNTIYAEIWPQALQLCEDNHACVRNSAAKEVGKLSLYLLSKNSDWKRHIVMCIKKYSKGHINNRITFLMILTSFAGVEIAEEFSEDVERLARDNVESVRIMCAETVILSKIHIWNNAKNILAADTNRDVLAVFGKFFYTDSSRYFITPPLIRGTHYQEIGGIIKFRHSSEPKFEKIENYSEFNI